jgi:hypothetical protein
VGLLEIVISLFLCYGYDQVLAFIDIQAYVLAPVRIHIRTSDLPDVSTYFKVPTLAAVAKVVSSPSLTPPVSVVEGNFV